MCDAGDEGANGGVVEECREVRGLARLIGVLPTGLALASGIICHSVELVVDVSQISLVK